MKVWTWLSPDDLCYCADVVGIRVDNIRMDGRAKRFTLAPVDVKRNGNRKYQRVSVGWREGRRVHAVCWHGHRDFMREVFKRDPNARIVTARLSGVIDYRGSEDFEQKFPKTGYANVGSIMYPTFAKDACTCSHDEWGVDSSIGGSIAVNMQQDMIRGCPHYIFMPDHYRADGSCKCNEQDNTDMREWGYTWNEREKVWA